MKITLKNFRCYEDAVFNFGEKGIVLLSGPSGAGKSTIFFAVYFALFGTGNKLAMNGKLSCSVLLEFEGMTIIRSKKPNRLIVNSIYEDDAGQSIIDKKFGDSFKTTGYISQNARDSFILMSPIEKLGFLEKFAFQDINLSVIKKRCKDLIKERNDNLVKTTSQLEMATLMLEELPEPEKVEFPLKCSKNNIQKAINNENIRSKNNNTLMKRCKKSIISLQEEIHSLQVLNAHLDTKSESLDLIVDKMSVMSIEESSIEYEGDDRLQEYKKQLSSLIFQRELIILQKRYEDDINRCKIMKEEETRVKQDSMNYIKSSIWKEYTKDECTTTIKEYKQTVKDIEKIEELESEIVKYVVDKTQLSEYIDELNDSKNKLEDKKKLFDKLEMQLEIFKCPSCSIQLKFHDDDLKIYDEVDLCIDEDVDVVNEEIEKLKRHIRKLESSIHISQNKLERHNQISESIRIIREQYEELPELCDIKKDLEYIISYKLSQDELCKKLFGMKESSNYSTTILSFEQSILKQKMKIDITNKEDYKYDKTVDEEFIRLKINSQQNNKEKMSRFSREMKNLSSQKVNLENDIKVCTSDHINTYKNIRDESELKSKLKLNMEELISFNIKNEEHNSNIEKIIKYQEYNSVLDTYNSWKTKISKFTKDEVECRKLYGSATLLKDKIVEAESIAMLNIISSINTHTQGYLEAFFPDNPISVKLVPFKETKKGKTVKRKPQINLEIEYKGMEADINMLSGGELSRVILSYSLALGEMFNTPMMLLDECTASLDQELTGVVMDGIRDHFPGKLVIIIAHQVVKGQFDKVIQVGTGD
jgi:energy-coupling factor transporter ATP-binding protein EcfA2